MLVVGGVGTTILWGYDKVARLWQLAVTIVRGVMLAIAGVGWYCALHLQIKNNYLKEDTCQGKEASYDGIA